MRKLVDITADVGVVEVGYVVDDVPGQRLEHGVRDVGVAVRTGHHCSQPVMDHFDIPATIRASFSVHSTRAEVDRVILDNIEAGGHHQGGRIRIGPDGLLYAGAGAWEPWPLK